MGNPYFNPHVNRPFAMGPYTAEEHPLCGVKRILEGTAELKSRIPEMAIICSAVSFLGVAANKCCICCSKCTEIMRKPGGTPGCVIRDRDVYLPIYKNLCGGNVK